MQHPFTSPRLPTNASATADHNMLPWRWLLQPVAKAPCWQHISEKTETKRRTEVGEGNVGGVKGTEGRMNDKRVEKEKKERRKGKVFQNKSETIKYRKPRHLKGF